MIHGLEIIAVGYHQPKDCIEFKQALDQCDDRTPYRATYYAVEADEQDREVLESWGQQWFYSNDNVGHAAACNDAAQFLADYDTLFFCNADTRLYSGNIDRLFDTLWSDEQFGCVGPRQVNQYGKITAGGIFGSRAAPKHRGWMESTTNYQDLRADAVTTSGALYMIKRRVWDELAGCTTFTRAELDSHGEPPLGAMPQVKHYFSETWPSYHMAAHGYRNVYEGRTTARHDWHQASPQGGYGERHLASDREHFRYLCDRHGLEHD